MPKRNYCKRRSEVNLRFEFTGKPITGWGGLKLVARWFERIGVRGSVEEVFGELMPGSNRGLHPWEVMVSFMAGLLMGAWRLSHIDMLRFDEPVQAMFGIRRVPSPSTLCRFFRRFSWRRSEELWPRWNRIMMDRARERFSPEGETVDIDSSVFERYGKQEGAEVGYNPRRPGRPSHHPVFAVASGAKWILHLWLRSGRTVSGSRAVEFITDMLHKKPSWLKVRDLRLDSGFFSGNVFDFLEGENIPYTAVVRLNNVVREAVMGIEDWRPLARGIEIGETNYRAADWKHSRRLVAVRQELSERPSAQGKLFPHCPTYRYQVLITTLPATDQEVWEHYKKRADVENRIKEWKEDFFMNGFALKKFFATEATLWLVAMTFNLIEWFKSVVLKTSAPRLMTMRIYNFLCGGWLGLKNGRPILRLHARTQYQKWFVNAHETLDSFRIPNAMQLSFLTPSEPQKQPITNL